MKVTYAFFGKGRAVRVVRVSMLPSGPMLTFVAGNLGIEVAEAVRQFGVQETARLAVGIGRDRHKEPPTVEKAIRLLEQWRSKHTHDGFHYYGKVEANL